MNVPCKICDAPTEIQGCVDADRSCEARRGGTPRVCGTPILYERCTRCGFLFTTAFDGWSIDEFQANIYNAGYAAADPDYADGSRARNNAELTEHIMGQLGVRRVLDYGGGDGTLATLLRAHNFDAHSWDPIADHHSDFTAEPASFDLVTAYEVFEHTPTPLATALQALAFLRTGGRLVFSTLLLDDVGPHDTEHWYIAPRNGHISLHTRASLQALFARLGWTVRHLNENLHVALR